MARLFLSFLRASRRFGKNREGATAIEFAIVAIPFFGMIFMIIVGGTVLSRFIAVTEISEIIVKFVVGENRNLYLVLLGLTLMYLVLGAILDVFGMLILTLMR